MLVKKGQETDQFSSFNDFLTPLIKLVIHK
jgi:hypothetical protein